MPRSFGLGHLCEAMKRCVKVETEVISGSGTIIQTGLVFTNLHLIDGQGDILVNGMKAELLFADIPLDFAALNTRTEEFRLIKFCEKARKNERVFYSTNPGIVGSAIQVGRISSVGDYELWVRVRCAWGFCGSGIYNKRGELVGLTDSMNPEEGREDIFMSACAIPGRQLRLFFDEVRRRI